jgi:hypothetical protein
MSRAFCVLLALAAVAVAMGAVQGGATAYTEPEEVRAVRWGLSSVDGPHALTLSVSTGYCVGKPKPRIDRIVKAWHPRSVVITVFLRYPRVHFGKHEACGGVGLGMSTKVRFDRSIVDRALYDGSSSPPQRRKRAH